VLALFNKSVSVTVKDGYMFRSDSNIEDLEGFAGAGLFDSFSSEQTETVSMNYKSEKLINDYGFRDYFMKQIGKIGMSIEGIYGGAAQNIEGCYYNNAFYVVQTRPQV